MYAETRKVQDAMKRQELIRHIEWNGCRLLREGGKHGGGAELPDTRSA